MSQEPDAIQTAAGDSFEARIAELYSTPGFLPSSIPLDTGRFLHSFVRLVRPKTVVELGTFRGVSMLWMARGLHENGGGVLHAFDTFEHSRLEDVTALLERFGLQSRVEVRRGDSILDAAKAAAGWSAPVDMLWVDADHRDLVPSAEITAFWPVIADGGFILLHDINPAKCDWDGPRHALDMLRRNGVPPQNACLVELPTAEGYGIAVIQKRGAAPPPILPSLAYLLYQWRSRFRFWLKGGGA